MSNCIKDLFDYDLVKKCSKCGIISLKSNFNKDNTKNDGLYNQCKICRKDYYMKNSIKLIQKQKDYYLDNRDRIKEYQVKNHNKIIAQKKFYSNNKYKSDINYRLICKTRSRIRNALQGKIKSSSSRDILGIDIDTYKKWLEFQFTTEMNWSNIEIDHVKPICMFDVTKDNELREAFNWKNTQPLLKKDHQLKGTKFNFLDYQLQFIKANQFIKLNEEKFNENIHQ